MTKPAPAAFGSLPGAGPMTDDEIGAYHEAAHAVFAVFGPWTKLAGPVVLNGPGNGDVVMSTDSEAIRRSTREDPGFDPDLPRIGLMRSLLAGPIAERMLAESGRSDLDERDLRRVCEGDHAVVEAQLEQLRSPRPGLLARLEAEIREQFEHSTVREAIERFAAVLIERRRLEADEATALIEAMRIPPLDPSTPSARRRNRWWLALLRSIRRQWRRATGAG